jgi:ribonuclease P protein component
MLKKAERVSRHALTGRHTRKRFRYGSFAIVSSSPGKAAVIVSKKTCPKAPDRARLRRRVYAILRDLIRAGRLKTSVAVYPTREALTARFTELKQELTQALP